MTVTRIMMQLTVVYFLQDDSYTKSILATSSIFDIIYAKPIMCCLFSTLISCFMVH